VKGHFGPINALAFNPDGKRYILCFLIFTSFCVAAYHIFTVGNLQFTDELEKWATVIMSTFYCAEFISTIDSHFFKKQNH